MRFVQQYAAQMFEKQRTPAVKFDDIPGQLPNESVPADIDLNEVAQHAVTKLNDPKASDMAEYAIWRDFLSFTGTFRTFFSKNLVLNTLQRLRKERNCHLFSLRDVAPRRTSSLDISWIDVDVAFNTNFDGLIAECRGIVSMTCEENGEWKIWMLRTWLENFQGYGHPDILDPANGIPEGLVNGHQNGGVNSVVNGHIGGGCVEYDVVIVGGGQAGLSTAGRMKALGLRYILLEQRPEIGDSWRSRYASLRWHTSKEYGNLPFGHTYLEEDDYMLPIERIAAGHKSWAEKYGLEFCTNSLVRSALYDDKAQIWIVQTTTGDRSLTFRAKNLVLTIGPGTQTPIAPEWATQEKIAASGFKGTIMHSVNYISSIPWAGKRGIVVGTANTGHDVAEDMANAGMDTTMIQRGATFIFPAEWLHAAEDVHYRRDTDIAEADRESFTYPNKVMREIINRATWSSIKNNPERFDALEKAGFKVERYGDIYTNLYVRFGGHYVDIGACARIVKGEIKVKGVPVKGLSENGLLLEDGSELPADLIVLCTGFDHNFRNDAKKIVGETVANVMDDFWSMDKEGEVRAHAKLAGRQYCHTGREATLLTSEFIDPALYYHGGDIRMARWFSRFIALKVQADALGKPLQSYLD